MIHQRHFDFYDKFKGKGANNPLFAVAVKFASSGRDARQPISLRRFWQEEREPGEDEDIDLTIVKARHPHEADPYHVLGAKRCRICRSPSCLRRFCLGYRKHLIAAENNEVDVLFHQTRRLSAAPFTIFGASPNLIYPEMNSMIVAGALCDRDDGIPILVEYRNPRTPYPPDEQSKVCPKCGSRNLRPEHPKYHEEVEDYRKEAQPEDHFKHRRICRNCSQEVRITVEKFWDSPARWDLDVVRYLHAQKRYPRWQPMPLDLACYTRHWKYHSVPVNPVITGSSEGTSTRLLHSPIGVTLVCDHWAKQYTATILCRKRQRGGFKVEMNCRLTEDSRRHLGMQMEWRESVRLNPDGTVVSRRKRFPNGAIYSEFSAFL